ncbi:MAG: hypothetical protein POG24_09325 [Acidocella sp.]|nr:hypothetical protein [Acidocella sp.]
MAKETLTANYAVQSAWNRTNPANHSFQSVAVLNKPDNLPPDGLAALVVTPLANGTCDGVTLQVFPLAGTCPAVQSVILSSGGRILGPLLNSRVMIDAAGKRLILLPGFNNTCMAISVHTTYGAP